MVGRRCDGGHFSAFGSVDEKNLRERERKLRLFFPSAFAILVLAPVWKVSVDNTVLLSWLGSIRLPQGWCGFGGFESQEGVVPVQNTSYL